MAARREPTFSQPQQSQPPVAAPELSPQFVRGLIDETDGCFEPFTQQIIDMARMELGTDYTDFVIYGTTPVAHRTPMGDIIRHFVDTYGEEETATFLIGFIYNNPNFQNQIYCGGPSNKFRREAWDWMTTESPYVEPERYQPITQPMYDVRNEYEGPRWVDASRVTFGGEILPEGVEWDMFGNRKDPNRTTLGDVARGVAAVGIGFFATRAVLRATRDR